MCAPLHYSRYRLHLFSSSTFCCFFTRREEEGWSRGSVLQYFDPAHSVFSYTASSRSAVYSVVVNEPTLYSNEIRLFHSFQLPSLPVDATVLACVEDRESQHCAWMRDSPSAVITTGVLEGPVMRLVVDVEGGALSLVYTFNHTVMQSFALPSSARVVFNFTLPYATCPPTLLSTHFVPLLPASASYSVHSSTGELLLVAVCGVSGASNANEVSDVNEGGGITTTATTTFTHSCECPSTVDANGIDWPQTHQGMLLQKPCVASQYGSMTYWCSSRCSWEYIAGRCTPIQCPAEIADGVLWEQRGAGEEQRVSCANGRGDALIRRCDEKGEWSPVRQGRCSCEAEGEWPSTPSQRYVYRKCPNGMSGSVSRRCNRFGEWSAVLSDCVMITCPEETLDDVLFPSVPADSDSRTPCPSGYFGTLTRHCNENGRWGAVQNDCTANHCDVFFFSLIKDGSMLISYSGSSQLSHLTASFTPHLADDIRGTTTSVTIPPLPPSFPSVMTIRGWWFTQQVEQCVVGNFFTKWFCFQTSPPVVIERNVTRDRMTVFLDVAFTDCKNRPPVQLVIETKEEGAQRSVLQFRCSQLSGCLPPKHAVVSIVDLDPRHAYSFRALLTTEDPFKPLLWSLPTTITPDDACVDWHITASYGSAALYLFYMRWTTEPALPVRSAAIRYRSAYQQIALRLQPWRSRPIVLCDNGSLCEERKMYLLPLETTSIWYQVELTVAVSERGCTRTKQIISTHFAPASPMAEVTHTVHDTYCVFRFEKANMPLRIRLEVLNVLNEVQQVVEAQLLLQQQREVRLPNLNPNSHYWVNTTLSDSYGHAVSNRTEIVTSAFQPIRHNLTLLHVSKDHLVAEAFSSSRGSLRCRFDETAPQVDFKQVSNFPLNFGAIHAGELRLFDSPVPPQARYLSCVVSAEDVMVLSAAPSQVSFSLPTGARASLP